MNTYVAYWAPMNVLQSNLVFFVKICWITHSIEKSYKCLWASGDFCLVCNGHLLALSIWPLFLLGYLLWVIHTFWCARVSCARTSMTCVKFIIMLFSLKTYIPMLLEFVFQISKMLLSLFTAFIFPTPSIANIIKTSLTVFLWCLASANVRHAVSIHQQLRFHQSFNLPMFFFTLNG